MKFEQSTSASTSDNLSEKTSLSVGEQPTPPCSDERMGLPSASYSKVIRNCRGAWRKIKIVRKKYGDFGQEEWKRRGNAVHAYIAGHFTGLTKDASSLHEDDVATADLCIQYAEEHITEIFGPDRSRLWIIPEKRMWLSSDKGKLLFSAQCDLIVVYDKVAYIPDFKSLYGDHQDSDENLQLRNEAVIVQQNVGCEKIYVAKIQPRCGKPGPPVVYGAATLEQARRELLEDLSAIRKQDADVTAGPHCSSCAAVAHCEVAQTWAVATDIHGMKIELPSKKQMEATIANLEPLQLLNFWMRWPTIKKIGGLIEERLESLGAQELSSLNLEKRSLRTYTAMPSTNTLWAIFSGEPFNMTQDEFAECLSFTKSRAVEVLKKRDKAVPSSKIEARMDEVLANHCSKYPCSPSLVIKKNGIVD